MDQAGIWWPCILDGQELGHWDLWSEGLHSLFSLLLLLHHSLFSQLREYP